MFLDVKFDIFMTIQLTQEAEISSMNHTNCTINNITRDSSIRVLVCVNIFFPFLGFGVDIIVPFVLGGRVSYVISYLIWCMVQLVDSIMFCVWLQIHLCILISSLKLPPFLRQTKELPSVLLTLMLAPYHHNILILSPSCTMSAPTVVLFYV